MIMQAAAPSCFVQSHFGFHHHRSTYHERAGMVKEIVVHADGTRYMQYTCDAERPNDTAPGDDEALNTSDLKFSAEPSGHSHIITSIVLSHGRRNKRKEVANWVVFGSSISTHDSISM